MNNPTRILFIDDHPDDRRLAIIVLRQSLPDLQVDEVADALAFAERVAGGRFAAAITEYRLAWTDGLDVLSTIKRVQPDCPVIVFTAQGGEAVAAEALRRGADGYVLKGSSGTLRLADVLREALAAAEGARAGRDGERRARGLIERTPVGMFTASAEGDLLEGNRAAGRILGAVDARAVAGRELASLLAEPAQQARVRALVGLGEPIRHLEAALAGGDAARSWVRLSAWPVREGDGPIIRWEGTLEDVTASKRVEEELAERAAALVQANAELQQFSATISHDLQEPLHLIARYSRLLAEQARGSLDERARRYVGHVAASAERMQAMIDGLLEYARVDTRGRSFAQVDLADAAADALSNLKAAIEESDAVIEVGVLPALAADRAQMVRLFQNLIGNALKFRGKQPPHVRVTSAQQGDHWAVSVADNGIGIEEDQLGRIFGLFQRLHGEGEFPGTGVGLAICKRIVERHGGQIWASSHGQRGSTFTFTIPLVPAQPEERRGSLAVGG